ncbi:DoxX family protein [Sphingomonas cannabina]|uniref:DoxX family protein n=1 Tax=Sphingomonas cannabina TaxID=2899123 RepID=UPI001F3D956C|nr:DoxX family protein [Sphingomonas cannabina]UIJ43821.1 DoxX family protein [Sphingomonas cannabina]
MPIPASWSDRLLSVLRIVVGLAFLHHGTSKFFGLPPFPMPLNPLLYVAGTLELVGGALIILGLFTRPVAFVLSGMSAVGYFMVHAPKSFFPSVNGGEAILLYCFIFLFLAAAGGGAWALDAARAKRS